MFPNAKGGYHLIRQAHVDRAVLHATIGHSSNEMTEHYSHVGAAEKLAAVDRLVKIVDADHRSPDSEERGNGAST